MYKVLIVEDEMMIAKQIKNYLFKWGLECNIVENFQDVLDIYIKYQPELVILDIGLPFFNGYHWCDEIRKLSKVPIIFLSSASESMNIVMAMSLGADDFIVKPFELEVLVAKIQAVLRRSYDYQIQSTWKEYKGIRLILDKNIVSYHEEQIELTKNEVRILDILLSHQGQIVSRTTLMNQLWKTDVYIDENTLSVNINRLRRKLESISVYACIHTKKGQGYILE